MQSKQKPSPKRPAKVAGADPWGPWIELVLGIGRAFWGCGKRLPPAQACGDVGQISPGAAGPLVLVHSSATVAPPARKARRSPLRLVARMRADA